MPTRNPTIRQKRVAKAIVENINADKPKTGGQIVEDSGYGPSMKKNSQVVLNSEGVQEALEELGFTEENAMKVVSEIMLNDQKDANARLKATDQVFKVKGSYAPEKTLNVNLDVSSERRIKSKEAINQFLGK